MLRAKTLLVLSKDLLVAGSKFFSAAYLSLCGSPQVLYYFFTLRCC